MVSTADQPADYEITATIRHPDHGPPFGAHRRGARPAAAIRGTSHLLVVGRDGRTLPPPLNGILLEGHTVANHTWNHENLAKLTGEAIDRTLERTQEILGELATMCLRPPYGSVGAHTREWAASHELSLVMWDSSPRDWLRPPAEEIAGHIVQWARPGVVLLMHDGGGDRSNTVQGLDMALERLADRGLRYEPVCR